MRNETNIRTLSYKKQEAIVHWREGLFSEPRLACLCTKLLVYFYMCVCRCRWYRLSTCLLVFNERVRSDGFFTPCHLFCDKSAWHEEEGHFLWESMIRDTTTIGISLSILPHRKKTGIYRSQCLERQRKGHENISEGRKLHRRENNGQQGCTECCITLSINLTELDEWHQKDTVNY